MKKLIIMLLTFGFIVLTNTGCFGTIYSAVVDERNVKTIANDTAIEFKILKNLSDEESSDLVAVSVTSYEGDVFLVGEYENNSQKNRFISSSKKVEGVKSVKSYLIRAKKDDPCDTKKNLGITVDVKTKLVGDKSIWSTNIHCKNHSQKDTISLSKKTP